MLASRIWLADGEKMYTIDTAETRKKWKRIAGYPKNLGKCVALLPEHATNKIAVCSLNTPHACLVDVELGKVEEMPDNKLAISATQDSSTGVNCVMMKTSSKLTFVHPNMWPYVTIEVPASLADVTHVACAKIGAADFFVCGGVGKTGRISRCHIVKHEGANEVAPMKHARSHHICIPLSANRILVAGGLVDYERPVILHVEIYDVANNTWFDAAPMLYPRYDAAAVLIDDGKSVLVFGGLLSTPIDMLKTAAERKNHQNQFVDAAEIYDIEANVWRFAPEYNLFVKFDSPRMCSLAPPKI